MSEKSLEARKEKIRKQLRKVGDHFLQVVKEEVDSCVLLCDMGRLERLTSIFHIHMDSETIRTLREKGLSSEIRELCDKAGRIKPKEASP